MSDDDSGTELQIAIADSLTLIKRKRDIEADEDYAWKIHFEEEEEKHHHYTSVDRWWTCSQCTYSNRNSSYCEMCANENTSRTNDAGSNFMRNIDREYYTQLEELEEVWNATEESLLVASKTWCCLTCHTTNAGQRLECSQCREPKIVQPINLWPCSKCTFDNSFSDSVCFMCGSPIPSTSRYLIDHTRPSECGLPGCCKSPVHYGFCSKAHFDLALKRNIIPPCEAGVEAVLVGPSGDYTAHLLRSQHPKHGSVKKQFLEAWKKLDGPLHALPRVERIFWIRVKPEILETFEQTKPRIGGNVQRLFHGTSQSSSCFFGTNQSMPPCMDTSCRVCSIIRTSFDLIHAKRGEGGTAWAHQTQQLRYGEGMYFSPVSSKSNDYNRLSERSKQDGRGVLRKWKCMFLCNVILGKSFRTKEGFLSQDKCPPPSYDSVWGETGPNLNYDEACIYDANQAIPSYLIVYSMR